MVSECWGQTWPTQLRCIFLIGIGTIGVNYGFLVRRTVFSIPEDKFKIWRTFGGQLAVLENIWRTCQFWPAFWRFWLIWVQVWGLFTFSVLNLSSYCYHLYKLFNFVFLLKKGTSGQPIFSSKWRTFWRTIVKLEDLEDSYFPTASKKGTSG